MPAATFAPAADLSYGQHTVTWRAVDNAGNSRDGFWTFRVVDAAAPVLSDAAPAAGSASELRRPQIAFTLSDVGTGIDPLTLRVLLDGMDVAPAGAFDGTRFTYVPASDLAFGSHELRVLAADRSGNPLAPTAWTFRVADVTAPTLGDPRPDAGSSSSDRTPAISVAAFDAGAGVDPATVAVTLDGRDISRLGTFSGGRFTYQPQELLGLGDHVVVARVSDRAGNPAAPFEWHFGVRDEAAPTRRRAAPGPGRDRARRRGDRVRRGRRRLRHRRGEPAGGRGRVGRDRVGDVRRLAGSATRRATSVRASTRSR